MHHTSQATPHVAGEDDYIKPRTTGKNITFILIAGFGSFMFGYANNVVTGSLAQTSFINKFLSGSDADAVIGGILGGFLGGAFIGSLLQGWISPRYGRKKTTALAAILLIVSGALMAGSVHVAMFILFRIVSGIGAGILTSNCPTYMSEISPLHTRGALTGTHGVGINVAYTMSSSIALGLNFIDHPYQWRLQFVIFTFFSILLLLSLFLIPESPRWLVEKERHEEALETLRTLHVGTDGHGERVVQAEMALIRAQIEAESSESTSYWHIFATPSLRKRAICSIMIWLLNIGSGVLVIANLTPLIFGGLGYGQTIQLGLSVVWVFTSGVGSFINGFLLDRLGRRPLLLIGGFLVGAVLVIEALLQKYYLGTTNKAGLNAATGIFYAYVFFWASFIDNTTYCYIPEIWPTHLRSKGSSIAYCAYYAVAIATSSPASQAFATIGYKYYFVFLGLCVVAIVYIFFVFPETNGLALEEIGEKFGDVVEVHFRDVIGDNDSEQNQDKVAESQIETAGEKTAA
ncbi:hypothetical protein A1O3_06858 [Capronia epimyces CBS 606.96]|uniref:Major facilitator superfamily (MFS) profile domain-containing protein n=1 Tax=Capronia epimyces CBS 606.96 TaxID=1182542 RepID=W9Y1C9_9EURO|nr:uncharacterized protein A1O3_06858 [Capronia epimyces CBS 606.96]EXJ83041.1 hypothetical protein A1O3_06858 [Capronia epimyces CBS 606.96]